MPRTRPGLLHVGIKGHVLALDRESGAEVWRTKLEGVGMVFNDFVHLHRDSDNLYASYNGHIFCLDPATGSVRWHNSLKGMGRGLASMISDAAPRSYDGPVSLMEQQRRLQASRHSGAV